MRVLAGDVGGTKTRLAVFELQDGRLETLSEQSYTSSGYSGLDGIVEDFLALDVADCDQACFGIAGPVRGDQARTTNLPWLIDGPAMAATFGFERVALINDLEANAWGVHALTKEDFRVLNEGREDVSGNASIIAAGTGLGEAGLYWDGQRHWPFASEGGHTDFSSATDLEIELLRFLGGRFDHVSWERVLSGAGLVHIHEFTQFKG